MSLCRLYIRHECAILTPLICAYGGNEAPPAAPKSQTGVFGHTQQCSGLFLAL